MAIKKTAFTKILPALIFLSSNLLADHKISLLPSGLNLVSDALKKTEITITEKRSLSNRSGRQAAVKQTFELLAELREEAAKSMSELETTKAILDIEIKELDGSYSSDEEKSFYAQKTELLNAREKIFSELFETWKLIESSIELNLAYLRANVDISFDLKVNFESITYYIDDLYGIEEEIYSTGEKLKIAKSKKEKVFRLIGSTHEKIQSIKREIESFAERKTRALEADPAFENKYDLKSKNEILDLKISLNKDTLRLLELKIRRLNLEIGQLNDEISILQYKKKDADALLIRAKDRLFVTAKDLFDAQAKFDAQQRIASAERDSSKKLLDEKTKEKIRLEEQIERLEANLKTISPKDFSNRSNFIYQCRIYLSLVKQKRALHEIDHEIGKLELKTEMEEVKALELQFKLRNVEVRLGLKSANFDIKKTLQLIKDDRNFIESRIKDFDAKRYLEPDSEDTSLRKLQLKAKIAETDVKTGDFSERQELREIHKNLEAELDALNTISTWQNFGSYRSDLLEISGKYKSLKNQHDSLIKEIREKIGERETWSRSPQAISVENLVESLQDTEAFIVKFFWTTQDKISPSAIFEGLTSITLEQVFGFLVTILIFLVLYFFFGRIFKTLRGRLGHFIIIKSGHTGSLPWTFLSGLLEFLSDSFFPLFTWVFIHALISIKKFAIFGFVPSQIDQYLITLFYLLSIPLFLNFSHDLLNHFGLINQRMSYFFFNEKSQYKNKLLLSILLYSGSIILPLKTAFFYFGPQTSKLPIVLLAAYSLIAEIIFLLFFDKEDLLSMIPKIGKYSAWVKEQISNYYYPCFFFFMTILIIYNPYIGYFNLAWKLALLIPLTIFIVAILFFIQEYLRKNLVQVFIIESDDGATDRFENAKMLYGFIIISMFFVMSLLAIFLISRMWGSPYTLEQLWEALSTKWAIPTVDGEVFGFVQIFQFILVLMTGFIGSSIVNKFILAKLFDVFNAEPGLQNTISRITHYLIIFMFTVAALSIIGLKNLVIPAFALVAVGISFALRDQLGDITGGIFILLERQFEIGHFIAIESEKIVGTVHKISFRSTVIRTARNFFVAIPNRIMISRPVTNWGLGKLAIGVEVSVEVTYQADQEKVRAVILSVLEENKMILKVPSPIVRLDELTNAGMSFYARGYFTGKRARDMWNIASEIRFAILEAFKKEGIEIAYPQRNVILKKLESDIYNSNLGGSGISVKIIENEAAPADDEPLGK